MHTHGRYIMASQLAEEKLEGARAAGVTRKRKASVEPEAEPGEGKDEKKSVAGARKPLKPPKRAKSVAAEPVAPTLRTLSKDSNWFVNVLPHQEPALNASDSRPFTIEAIVRLFAENLLANFLRKLFGHAQKRGKWDNGQWFLAGCAFGTASLKAVRDSATKPKDAKQAAARQTIYHQWYAAPIAPCTHFIFAGRTRLCDSRPLFRAGLDKTTRPCGRAWTSPRPARAKR